MEYLPELSCLVPRPRLSPTQLLPPSHRQDLASAAVPGRRDVPASSVSPHRQPRPRVPLSFCCSRISRVPRLTSHSSSCRPLHPLSSQPPLVLPRFAHASNSATQPRELILAPSLRTYGTAVPFSPASFPRNAATYSQLLAAILLSRAPSHLGQHPPECVVPPPWASLARSSEGPGSDKSKVGRKR